MYARRRVQNSKVANVFTDGWRDVCCARWNSTVTIQSLRSAAKCELPAFCRGCPAVASGKDGNFTPQSRNAGWEVKNDASIFFETIMPGPSFYPAV